MFRFQDTRRNQELVLTVLAHEFDSTTLISCKDKLVTPPQCPHVADTTSTSGWRIFTVRPADVRYILAKQWKISPADIMEDVARREKPRYADDPPAAGVLAAIKELKKNTTAARLDLMRDCGISDPAVLYSLEQMAVRELRTSSLKCLACPEFDEHIVVTSQAEELYMEREEIRYLLSDKSLHLLPEYKQRIAVLQALDFCDPRQLVKLKGSVACHISTHELLITELMFQGVFTQFTSSEVAGLLSCCVREGRPGSQDKAAMPTQPNLLRGVKIIQDIALSLGETQVACGLQLPRTELLDRLNFDLVQVVYEWAEGVSFRQLRAMTDCDEGTIVRAIIRLDEALRGLKDASVTIGDPALRLKVEAASSSVKRDIVFAASLYTSEEEFSARDRQQDEDEAEELALEAAGESGGVR